MLRKLQINMFLYPYFNIKVGLGQKPKKKFRCKYGATYVNLIKYKEISVKQLHELIMKIGSWSKVFLHTTCIKKREIKSKATTKQTQVVDLVIESSCL